MVDKSERGDGPGGSDQGNTTDSRVTDGGSHHPGDDPFTRTINPLITDRPWAVIVAFLLLTIVFAGGIGGLGEQQAGSDQFTEDLEEQRAFEAMQENFARGSRATGGSGATMFVSDDRNVLAKPVLLRMLEAQHRLETHDRLRIISSSSPATSIALQIDPSADTPEKQYRAIDRASQRRIDAAIRDAHDAGRLGQVSTDLNPAQGSASVAQLAVSYDTPSMASSSDRASIQYRTVDVVDGVEGFEAGENVVVFSDAIIQDEILALLTDTAIIVFPAALLLITFFLAVAYRDPVDLSLGVIALLMTLVWTFGFMGYVGIPFSDMLVMVFPLLLAVGIDFGIHIINRYREERERGASIGEAMGITSRQLTVAFLIVTITTVFSFAANLVSSLDQLQNFGVVAAVGIVFTFLLFGVFLPAGKVAVDRLREGTRFPRFGTTPLGREGSMMGQLLTVGATMARIAPALVLVVALVGGAAGGVYGTGVDTEFSQESFFPDQERVELYQSVLPEPLAPSDYTFMAVLAHLEEDFEQGFVGTVTVYIEDRNVRSNVVLEDVDRAQRSPPPAFVQSDRRANADSIVSVMNARANADPEFAALVKQHDTTGNGIPDRNVEHVLEVLLDSAHGDQARNYVTDDLSATRINYRLNVDADQSDATIAAGTVADSMRLDATPTGRLVVNRVVIDRITRSAIDSLLVAFLLTAVFLMVAYWWLEDRAIYGLINLVPVLITVGVLAGSMRYLSIPLTPFNAPILSVSIGLGVDYTVHYMHRFVDEYETRQDVHEALRVTAQGTGGALTGSMLTTVTGLGVVYLALIPLIMDFGILLALGVLYAYLASVLVLPSVIVFWIRVERRLGGRMPDWASVTPH